ncbi:MAG TPA: YHYH protein [Candidatus Saccharimonadales bacterium]|nr:YHYH protein [Candidatus Saccharimonadales bacterium]
MDQKPGFSQSTTAKSNFWAIFLVILIGLLGIGAGGYLVSQAGKTSSDPAPKITSSTTPKTTTSSTVNTAHGLQLDPSKNYGNKYANGILPVGDGKYSTTTAKKGYVYACSQYAQNLTSSQGGAGTRGPWFMDNNTEYDVNKKTHVNGSVMWQASFTEKLSGNTRTLITNDLPDHPTGIFPIANTDPAYAYDRNPNTIKGQTLTFALPANPTYGDPSCMGGQSGIMLTGVALFNAFDAGGRDAGAWEVQDKCSGHPEKEGEYHYHTLSACIKDVGVSNVIGFALDGFPITGPKVGTNNYLTTSDLDECHGITSQITLDGKKATMYHYVMTEDFPYSVSCFRGSAIQPPGLQGAGQPQHP